MRILFASSEVAPFAKTGGLADVAGALPKALKSLGHDIRVVLPKYRTVDALKHGLRRILPRLPVPIAGTVETAEVWEGAIGSVPAYFIQQDDYYDREGLYQVEGRDHPDNAERVRRHHGLERILGLGQLALVGDGIIKRVPILIDSDLLEQCLLLSHYDLGAHLAQLILRRCKL